MTRDPQQRWICTRIRPGDGAPSLSIGVRGGSENMALIHFLERYPDQSVDTVVYIRPEGVAWQHYTAAFTRNEHRWDQTYPTRVKP